jgi:hypothetical protein
MKNDPAVLFQPDRFYSPHMRLAHGAVEKVGWYATKGAAIRAERRRQTSA